MVAVVLRAIYCTRHIIRLTFSIPVVPENVSLYFRKGDAENKIPYIVTFRKSFLFPEVGIFLYTGVFKIHINICEMISILHISVYSMSFMTVYF